MTDEETDGYWVVTMEVFAFDDKETARSFQEALMNAFTNMPKSKHLGASSQIVFRE